MTLDGVVDEAEAALAVLGLAEDVVEVEGVVAAVEDVEEEVGPPADAGQVAGLGDEVFLHLDLEGGVEALDGAELVHHGLLLVGEEVLLGGLERVALLEDVLVEAEAVGERVLDGVVGLGVGGGHGFQACSDFRFK